jgi:hypothetical protein
LTGHPSSDCVHKQHAVNKQTRVQTTKCVIVIGLLELDTQKTGFNGHEMPVESCNADQQFLRFMVKKKMITRGVLVSLFGFKIRVNRSVIHAGFGFQLRAIATCARCFSTGRFEPLNKRGFREHARAFG